jgi:formylglycine-generating enzyme required for sulfatase activity
MKAAWAAPFAALCVVFSGCAIHGAARPLAAPEPGMMEIPRGDFTMGRDAGPLNEQPSHEVDLGRYFLDRTEVSAADFAAFLNAEGNPGDRYFTADDLATIALAHGPDARSRYEPRAGFATFPANNVSWYGADAYCRWRGRRLPTEAEWEKGARGTDERRYPWGSPAPAPPRARFAQSWAEQRLGVLVPVDALPEGASTYGLLNMAGNVLEWVQDWYRQNLCDFCSPEGEAHLRLLRELTSQGEAAAAPAETTTREAADTNQRQAPPRENPTGPSTGVFKVLRGGSWQEHDPEDLLTTRRYWLDPSQRFPSTGFRCAMDPAGRHPQEPRP